MEEHIVWYREVRYYPTDVTISGETYSEVIDKYKDMDFSDVDIDFDHPDITDSEFIID